MLISKNILSFRHLNSLDDATSRTKWMNVKKAVMEETEVVKQLDAERRAFKEAPTGRSRPSSPPINSTKSSSFVFQPLDEYPNSSSSSGAPIDDPDVWRPPTRDVASRRPARAGQSGMRKSPNDGAWARGGPTTRAAPASRGGRGGKSAAASARSSAVGKKGAASKSPKPESTVSFI